MTQDYQGRYAQFAVADDPSLPEHFQNYAIDKNKIGEGPISFCYRARRVDTNEPVRLKVLRRRLSQNSELVELFHKQARLFPEYRGDAIQPYRGWTSHNDIVMWEFAFVEGHSLRSIIDENAPLHPDLVGLIAQGIMQALNQIHGVRPSPGMGNLIPLHKNLKPENVFLTNSGKIVITDIDMLPFCRLADRLKLDLPYPLNVYEAPEQLLKNGYADRRSDIYSLGLIMFEMATGRRPYFGNNIFEVRQNVRENLHDNLDSLYPSYQDAAVKSLSKSLARLISQMVEHNPEKRIQTLLDLEGALLNYFKGAAYDYPAKTLADFLKLRSFQTERARKKGFIDRLFGG
ncbi:MAG: protein kinase [Candidatus Zixiibacteriota bacterium]